MNKITLDNFSNMLNRLAQDMSAGGLSPFDLINMILAEIAAYDHLVNSVNPYMIKLFAESEIVDDFMCIGILAKTEQDYNANKFYPIYLKSYNYTADYLVADQFCINSDF